MYRYTAVAQLREIVMTMERDLGLTTLSHNEKEVLYAVQSVESEALLCTRHAWCVCGPLLRWCCRNLRFVCRVVPYGM